jgi:TRAP-type C4-dicarboxylate transport system permease small subunit
MSTDPRPAVALLRRIEIWVLTILGVAMTLIMFTNATMRYLFSTSLVWSEEVIRILFVWAMFIAITESFIRNEHIGFDNIAKMGGWPTHLHRLVYALSLTVVGGVLAWHGWRFTILTGDVPLAATNMSTTLLMWPGVIAGAIWTVIGAIRLVRIAADLTTGRAA